MDVFPLIGIGIKEFLEQRKSKDDDENETKKYLEKYTHFQFLALTAITISKGVIIEEILVVSSNEKKWKHFLNP